jgi:hypothetical protein
MFSVYTVHMQPRYTVLSPNDQSLNATIRNVLAFQSVTTPVFWAVLQSRSCKEPHHLFGAGAGVGAGAAGAGATSKFLPGAGTATLVFGQDQQIRNFFKYNCSVS